MRYLSAALILTTIIAAFAAYGDTYLVWPEEPFIIPAHPVNAAPVTPRPCDIYGNAGTPCVAAHSTTRALFAAYNGPLYQVQRSSDGSTQDIGLLAMGDYANAAEQDSFCANTSCFITRIFDQSPRHDALTIENC